MSLIFADTSAIAKRYLSEIGSAWVRGWCDLAASNTIVIAETAIVEMVALLARRQREGTVNAGMFARLRNDFLLHVDREYAVIDVRNPLLLDASQLVTAHPLRTLDAIQLASARTCAQQVGNIPTFISADRRLLAIAAAEGFPTDDPNAHP
jgi:uncharacterized protein